MIGVVRDDPVVLLPRVAVVGAGRRDRVVRDGDGDDPLGGEAHEERVEDGRDVGLVRGEPERPGRRR